MIYFKKVTFNWLSFMVGFHYGRNPANGRRFLHVAPVPFIGFDFGFDEPIDISIYDRDRMGY